jgi:hypothetical protein
MPFHYQAHPPDWFFDDSHDMALAVDFSSAVTSLARRYIDSNRIDMDLEQAIGWVVRAFDPCIACATR